MTSEEESSQQTIKQQARRKAQEVGARRRMERIQRERRVMSIAERVLIAIGERNASVIEAEIRAGAALRELTDVEGLSLVEAVTWCAGAVSLREASRLRRSVEGSDSHSAAGRRRET